MKIVQISTIQGLSELRKDYKNALKVGFVPTMGYLHEGHLSLVKKAKQENDKVIVSIFVNPAQFGPKEDLSRYPRNLERDLELLEKLGVDVVFTPSAEEMYPDGFQTYVEPTGKLAEEVEGASRPGHFRGVATIVLKLFNSVNPTNAYFGQKDAQQSLIVSKLLADLNLPINLHILPTIREKDGLAMSSRNAYLNADERKAATVLYRALSKAKENASNKSSILKKLIKETVAKESLVKLEYVEIRHRKSFEQLETVSAPALILIAAKVGKTRLIDNFVLQEDNTWNTGIIL